MDKLRTITYNCRGYKSSISDVLDLCATCDIILLQETWLLPSELHLLTTLHPEFSARGISAVNITDDVLRGRPHGGLAVLWMESLSPYMTVALPDGNVRMMNVIIQLPQCAPLLLVNVYMPYQSDANYDVFMDTLGRLSSIIDDAETSSVSVIGDFNAAADTLFAEELDRWCAMNEMTISTRTHLDASTHTYVSMAHGTTSWLDHAVCSTDAHRMIEEIEVLDFLPASDHLPLRISFSLPDPMHRPQLVGAPSTRASDPGYRWDRASEADILRYREATIEKLRAICLDHNVLSCDDPMCDNVHHSLSIDAFYEDICLALRSCSEGIISHATHDYRREHVVPGWNELVADAHAAARNAYVVWRNMGKPRHGAEFDDMRCTRRIFKTAMRRCRAQEEMLREEALARSLSQKDCKGFWKQIAQMSSTRAPLPTSIEGHIGESAIASMWRSHFKDIMNAVKRDDHRRPVQEAMQATTHADLARISPRVVRHALHKKMKKGKACGLEGIAAEHFIYADDVICVLLSMLFNCMLSHGYLPASFMISAILPIVKSKTGDTTAKSNYRPVAIVTACSKILESCIMHSIDPHLSTSDNQFGFKVEHSTDLCIFALKNVASYYVGFNERRTVAHLTVAHRTVAHRTVAHRIVAHWTVTHPEMSEADSSPPYR